MEPEYWIKWYVDNNGKVRAGSVEPSWICADDESGDGKIVWLVQQ